jgi:hypothetical protein
MGLVSKICLNCEKQFATRPSLAHKVHNCSKQCGYETRKKRHLVSAECAECKKEFLFTKSSRREQEFYFCSVSCAAKQRSKSRSSDWKVGKDGYIYKTINSKRVLQHRFVMEQHLGRRLNQGENVHHKNGDKQDNRIENLELWFVQQPKGQRMGDRIEAAKKLLEDNGFIVIDASKGLVDGLLYGSDMSRVFN